MIYSLYKLVNPLTLSNRTKGYISCSRTLWPILNNETTDLSYPDFACITEDHDPEEYKEHKDYDYFWAHYEKIPHTITMMNWRQHEMKVCLTRQEIAEDVGKERAKALGLELLSLPRPSWLYGNENDVPLKRPVVLPTNLIAQPKPIEKKVPKKKAKQERPVKVAPEKDQSKVPVRIEEELVEPINTLATLESLRDEAAVDVKENSSVFQSQDVAVAAQEAVESFEESYEVPQKIKSVYTPPVITTPLEPLLPRGMRLFHSKASIGDHESAPKIRGGWETLVDTIFDYRNHGQGFNFGEFKALWEHINGIGSVRSSQSGGSHYALLNKQGEVIGGTFAHGRGHQYTKSTVRYLRAALNAVCVSSSK